MNIDSPHICVHCTMYIHNDVDLERERETERERERDRERQRENNDYNCISLYVIVYIRGCFLGSIQLQLKINNVKNRCLGGG